MDAGGLTRRDRSADCAGTLAAIDSVYERKEQ